MQAYCLKAHPLQYRNGGSADRVADSYPAQLLLVASESVSLPHYFADLDLLPGFELLFAFAD